MKAMRNMPQLSCTVRDEDLFFINRIAMHMTIEKGKPVTVSEAVRFIFANARREWTEKNKQIDILNFNEDQNEKQRIFC